MQSYGSDLTVSRSYSTRDYTRGDASGMFGPGWTSSVGVEDAGVDYTGLTVAGSLVQLGLPEGNSIGFTVKTTTGTGKTLTPEVGVDDLTLTYTVAGDSYTLADLDGTVVTFTKPSGSALYKPTAVTTPGSGQTTTTSWETATVAGAPVTRPTRILAPVPAGVTCGAGTAGLLRGCRALAFTYATGTTATGGAEAQWGDYTGRVGKSP